MVRQDKKVLVESQVSQSPHPSASHVVRIAPPLLPPLPSLHLPPSSSYFCRPLALARHLTLFATYAWLPNNMIKTGEKFELQNFLGIDQIVTFSGRWPPGGTIWRASEHCWPGEQGLFCFYIFCCTRIGQYAFLPVMIRYIIHHFIGCVDFPLGIDPDSNLPVSA